MAAVHLLKLEVVISQPWIDTSSKFGTQTDFHLKRMQSLALNTEVAFGFYGHHLEKSILRHNSCSDRLTETKFGMLM